MAQNRPPPMKLYMLSWDKRVSAEQLGRDNKSDVADRQAKSIFFPVIFTQRLNSAMITLCNDTKTNQTDLILVRNYMKPTMFSTISSSGWPDPAWLRSGIDRVGVNKTGSLTCFLKIHPPSRPTFVKWREERRGSARWEGRERVRDHMTPTKVVGTLFSVDESKTFWSQLPPHCQVHLNDTRDVCACMSVCVCVCLWGLVKRGGLCISGLFWLSVSRSRTGDVHEYAGLAVSMWHAEAHTFLSPQSHCRCRHRDTQSHFYGLLLILIYSGCFAVLFLRFTSCVMFSFFHLLYFTCQTFKLHLLVLFNLIILLNYQSVLQQMWTDSY